MGNLKSSNLYKEIAKKSLTLFEPRNLSPSNPNSPSLPASRPASGTPLMSALTDYLKKQVKILTLDGRIMHGTLSGFDHLQNLILTDSNERIYSADRGVEVVELGVYLIRGDNVCVVGEVDVEEDAKIDMEVVRANAINPVDHTGF